MRTVKMAIGVLSFLMFVTCFVAAAPMVQQQKTTPSNEATNEVVTPSKSDKKINFIQKIMLKKAQKKMKKISDEEKYRTWAELSVLFGVFAILPLVGLFFMLLSIILGVRARKKSQDKKTKKIARIGFLLGILFFAIGMGLIIHSLSGGLGGVSWGTWGW